MNLIGRETAPDPERATAGPGSTADTAAAAPSARRLRLDALARGITDLVFALLLLAVLLLAGWLSARHDHDWDWTTSGRNSLSAESLSVLEDLEPGLSITVYAPPGGELARAVYELLQRYRRARPDIDVELIDPQLFPEQARADDVSLLGQLVLEYQGRRETLGVLSEEALTNAIARLTLQHPPWVAVLEGHGERSVTGAAGPDLGRFAQLLHQRGFRLRPLDLATHPNIPDNTDVLLITTPSIALFPGEAEAVVGHLARGGNLLWLLDPPAAPGDGLLGLEPVARYLGLELLPGTVVDAAAAEQGLDTPTIAVVQDWPAGHPLGRGLTQPALLPGSAGFVVTAAPDWLLDTTLTTGPLSWNETGPARGEISRDESAGEQNGPLPVAMVLTRAVGAGSRGGRGIGEIGGDLDSDAGFDFDTDADTDGREQRVVVVGDGDFLSNAHLDNGANRALGLRLARWLAGREALVEVPEQPSDRDALVLSPVRAYAITGGALVGLPLLLVVTGLLIRWRRGRA